eukprot:746654-Hanusia_phi.AAC.5
MKLPKASGGASWQRRVLTSSRLTCATWTSKASASIGAKIDERTNFEGAKWEAELSFTGADGGRGREMYSVDTSAGEIVTVQLPPIDGEFLFLVKGAQAEDTDTCKGGRGAILMGKLQLKAASILHVLVGGKSKTNGRASGGGGGSFVVLGDDLLFAAGGGGGAGEQGDGTDASLTEEGDRGGASTFVSVQTSQVCPAGLEGEEAEEEPTATTFLVKARSLVSCDCEQEELAGSKTRRTARGASRTADWEEVTSLLCSPAHRQCPQATPVGLEEVELVQDMEVVEEGVTVEEEEAIEVVREEEEEEVSSIPAWNKLLAALVSLASARRAIMYSTQATKGMDTFRFSLSTQAEHEAPERSDWSFLSIKKYLSVIRIKLSSFCQQRNGSLNALRGSVNCILHRHNVGAPETESPKV